MLFAANDGGGQHERKYGNYCCLGFHETPRNRPSWL
jgi:hypothetical protein